MKKHQTNKLQQNQQEQPNSHENTFSSYYEQNKKSMKLQSHRFSDNQIQSPLTAAQLKQQLQLQRQPDYDEHKELSFLIFSILNYPSLSQAHIHEQANRLGGFDLHKDGCTKNKDYCKCCGYVKQDQLIPICTSMDEFPSVGISTYLFFTTIKNLLYLLLLLLMIHSVYSLSTNIYIANSVSQITIQTIKNINALISLISLDSKVTASNNEAINEKNNFMYLIQMWISVGLVVVWSLSLYIIKYFQRKYEVKVNKQTISAADFSIIIENYPRNLSLQQLQQQFNEYAVKLQCNISDQFRIQKLNLSPQTIVEKQDEQQMEEMNEKYYQMLDMFAEWICYFDENNGLPFSYEKRSKIYHRFQNIKSKRIDKGRQILKTIMKSNKNIGLQKQKNQLKNDKNNNNKSIAVVTFKYSNTKDTVSRNNYMDFARTVRHLLRCCPQKKKFVLLDKSQQVPVPFKNIKIWKAPQPEDIKWQNLCFSNIEKLVRKTGTYLATLILLSISFVLVYLLSIYEQNNSNELLNFVVSFTISAINFIIGFIIRFLTIFQKDFTETGYQTSLAIKSIWAQLLNSIVIPIVVNYIIEKNNVFGVNGLSSDVIYLSITNSLLFPLSKLIDPYYRYIKIKAFYYRSSLKQRLLMNQTQLNQSQQLMQFQTGYEYIYFINLYLFTSFFISLQPCICIFSIFGMLSMYWLQKHSLLTKMKRPVPGTDLVNSAMSQMISFGPIFYCIGALLWSHILDGYKVGTSSSIYYIPNLIAGGLAALFFFFPFNIIFDKYMPKVQAQNLDYQDCRILLNSQYDRTNPATMQQAIKQYQQYLQNYIQQQEQNEGKQKIKKLKSDDNQTNSTLSKFAKLVQVEIQRNSKRKISIDKVFLQRKKELLKNKTIMKIGFGVNKVDGLIQTNKNQKQSSSSKNNIKNVESQVKTQKSHNFIQPPTQQKIKSKIQNASKQKKVNIVIQGQKVPQFIQSYGQRQIKPQSVFKKQDNSSTQSKKPVLKIRKQQSPTPKRVQLDFLPFLPLQNVKQNKITQNNRDDRYMNYFAKNVSINEEKEKQNKDYKRAHNPYQKSFR